LSVITLKVNGQSVEIDIEPETPLLWVLRDNLNLTGTKYGCGIGQCGSCTVHLNGHAVRSCTTTAADAQNFEIVTIEGLSENADHPVQKAWIEGDVPQCGYCQSGQIMAAAALLRQTKSPSDDEIDSAMTNICRCGTYPGIRAAIKQAALGQGG
jgi:isoquinoline 1-oxidoreductase alpha subunit